MVRDGAMRLLTIRVWPTFIQRRRARAVSKDAATPLPMPWQAVEEVVVFLVSAD
jgi:hypothetical protein